MESARHFVSTLRPGDAVMLADQDDDTPDRFGVVESVVRRFDTDRYDREEISVSTSVGMADVDGHGRVRVLMEPWPVGAAVAMAGHDMDLGVHRAWDGMWGPLREMTPGELVGAAAGLLVWAMESLGVVEVPNWAVKRLWGCAALDRTRADWLRALDRTDFSGREDWSASRYVDAATVALGLAVSYR